MLITKCCYCGSKQGKLLFKSSNIHIEEVVDSNEQFNVFKCGVCGNIYLKGVSIDRKYYAKNYDERLFIRKYQGNKPVTSTGRSVKLYWWDAYYKQLVRLNFSQKIKIIKRLFKNKIGKIDILDVGSGSGNKFLNLLPKEDFNIYANDMDLNALELVDTEASHKFPGDFLQIAFENKKFNLITMWHVLEHTTEPSVFISKVKDLLKQNGYLIFSVPNSAALGLKIGKMRWFHLDSPRHLFIPNKTVVEGFVKNNGLKLEKIMNSYFEYPFDLWVSVRKSFLKYMIYPLYPFIRIFDEETLMVISKKL